MFKTFLVAMAALFLSLTISFAFSADLVPYTVFIKGGSLFTKLKDKSVFVLPKGIYAKVMELDPKRRNRFYVYDNQGNAIYETSALGIVEIDDDTRVLPNIDAEKIYPPKSVFKATNKVAQFESQVSLHFDNLQLASFNNIYSDEISSVLSNRYEARTLYVSELPVKFGFGLNYQSAYWKNDFEEVKLSILSVGPQFKYHFFQSENFNIHALLGVEVALIYEGVTSTFKDKYNAQLYDLGIESEWNSPFGIITFGSHFRHHEVALTQSDRLNLELTPKEFSVNSLGAMLGYKIEWEL